MAAHSIAAEQGAVAAGLLLVNGVVPSVVRVPDADVAEPELRAHHGRRGPAAHPVAAAGPPTRAARSGLSAVQSQVAEAGRQPHHRRGRPDHRPGVAQAVHARSVAVLPDHRRRCGVADPDKRTVHVAAVRLHGHQRTVAEVARPMQEPHVPGPKAHEAHQVVHQQVCVHPGGFQGLRLETHR